MILLTWNCQGLARASAKRTLRALIKQINHDILFLVEVKVDFEKIKNLLFSLEFYNKEYVKPKGKSGGLTLC